MHELGITQEIVAIAAEAAQGRRVKRVTVEVGQFSGVVPAALAFCFDVVAKGTILGEAVLDIEEIPGRLRCNSCGADFSSPDLLALCACGSHDTSRIGGDELLVRKMEVEEAV